MSGFQGLGATQRATLPLCSFETVAAGVEVEAAAVGECSRKGRGEERRGAAAVVLQVFLFNMYGNEC